MNLNAVQRKRDLPRKGVLVKEKGEKRIKKELSRLKLS